MTRRTQRGFTITELLATVAVAAIALGVAVPSFGDTLSRRKIEGAANELGTDLQWARTEAVRRGLNVWVMTTGATQYSVRYVDAANVTQTLKDVTLPGGLSVTPGQQATFESVRGILDEASPPTFELSSDNSAAKLNVVLNVMGRTQLCSPSGAMTGYKAC